MLPVGLPRCVTRSNEDGGELRTAKWPPTSLAGRRCDDSRYPCANPAFCAITAPAVATLVELFPRPTRVPRCRCGVSTLAPADPQAPLPPPPKPSLSQA